MTAQELAALSDQALLEQKKKAKSAGLLAAGLIGFIVGVAVYGTIRNGLGWSTLLALLAIPMTRSTRQQRALLQQELQKRNLA